MIRIPVYVFLVILFLWKCAPQENKTSEQTNPDSLSIKSNTDKIESIATIAPLDTIVASYSNGQKLHLYILAYHDSLPGRPIKDFEVRDVEKNETVFRSVTKRLELGYETDPMKGEYDSIFVVPTYSISSKDPLAVDLDFIEASDRWRWLIGDLTYRFYDNTRYDQLSFIKYTFQVENNNVKVKSSLRFVPNRCEMTETELINRFNKLKDERHLATEGGEELMKSSFVCFLNNKNSYYSMITKEIKEASGESLFPGGYYVYIVYFDSFIINLTFP